MVCWLTEVRRLQIWAFVIGAPLIEAMLIVQLAFIFNSVDIFFICINVVQVHLVIMLSEALLIAVSAPGLLKLANFLQVYLAIVLSFLSIPTSQFVLSLSTP